MFGLKKRVTAHEQLVKTPAGLGTLQQTLNGMDREELNNLRQRLSAIEAHLGIMTVPVLPHFKVIEVPKAPVGGTLSSPSYTGSSH